MEKKKQLTLISISIIILILIIDQASKIWVKTNMSLYESIEITSWFKILFVENNGMAFGMEIIGKTFLSLFRIVAVCFIGYYIYNLIRKGYATGFIICISLIWAGAFGNIIDCLFYGEIFTESTRAVTDMYGEVVIPGQVATFVPWGEGYASILHGKVVDMLSFPLFSGTFPSWMPFCGGDSFTFFSPIFNIADSAITVGIFILILFYRKTLSLSLERTTKE